MPIDALPIPHHLQATVAAPEFVDDPTVALPIPHAEQQRIREEIRYGAGGRDITVSFGSVATRTLNITAVSTRSLTSTASNGS